MPPAWNNAMVGRLRHAVSRAFCQINPLLHLGVHHGNDPVYDEAREQYVYQPVCPAGEYAEIAVKFVVKL